MLTQSVYFGINIQKQLTNFYQDAQGYHPLNIKFVMIEWVDICTGKYATFTGWKQQNNCNEQYLDRVTEIMGFYDSHRQKSQGLTDQAHFDHRTQQENVFSY